MSAETRNGPQERHVRSRTIPRDPSTVFAVLTDPDRHQETEPGDWVRTAIDLEPLSRVGQVFAVNMWFPGVGGDYVMHNRVTHLEPDRTIAWEPGQPDENGVLEVGGWIWRYDLAPVADGTEVTLTYDWSNTPAAVREEIGGMPPFGAEFLDESLAALDRAATRPA